MNFVSPCKRLKAAWTAVCALALLAIPATPKLDAPPDCNCLCDCFPQHLAQWIEGGQYWESSSKNAYPKVPHDTPPGVTINNLVREAVSHKALMQTRFASGSTSCEGDSKEAKFRTGLAAGVATGGPWIAAKHRCVLAPSGNAYCD